MPTAGLIYYVLCADGKDDPTQLQNATQPQNATQRRWDDATGSDSEEQEQETVPVRERRGLRQRRRRSRAGDCADARMQGTKEATEQRCSRPRGHRDNEQRPSMLTSAALTAMAVLMTTAAAAAEPHGSPDVAGAHVCVSGGTCDIDSDSGHN
jgi:hypothetical protein